MTEPTTAAGRALVRRFGPGLSQRQLVEADVAQVEAEARAAALSDARAAMLGLPTLNPANGVLIVTNPFVELAVALAAIDALRAKP